MTSDRRYAVSVAVVAATAALGALLGGVTAVNTRLALAAIAAVLFFRLVTVDLDLGIAVWAALLFFEDVPIVNAAIFGAGVAVLLAWVPVLRRRQAAGGVPVIPGPALVVPFALLLTWIMLSVTWAADPDAAVRGFANWVVVGTIFAVFATAPSSAGSVRRIAVVFVVGSLASVLYGIVQGDLGATDVPDAGRLAGGIGDANFLGLALVAGAVCAVGLHGSASRAGRVSLEAAIVLLVAAIVATGSRGSLVGAAVAIPLAVLAVAATRRRGPILLLVLLVAAAGLLVAPMGERLTAADGGSGRQDLWRLAGTVAAEHPLGGVGIANFGLVAPEYVRDVGPLTYVDLVNRPHDVHNVYLQLLAETGVIGALLFLVFVGGCLAAGVRAARAFDRAGARGDALLARAVAVAAFAMLLIAFFLPMVVDRRFWVVLALAPALERIAMTARGTAAATHPAPGVRAG